VGGWPGKGRKYDDLIDILYYIKVGNGRGEVWFTLGSDKVMDRDEL